MPATDTEALVLQMSAELKQFQNQMLRAAGDADRAAQRIERRFQQQNQRVVQDFNRFGAQVRTILATIGLGIVVRDVTQLADTWTTVGNRIAFAGIQGENLATVQQLIANIASRTRSDLDSTADLFARMYRSSEDLGASLSQVAAVTEIVSKALAGASQTERAGAIRQLGQGLGSGRLQGDELRSILENSRPIAEAIAAEFETTVGNLRELGKQGVLESRRVFQAILRAGDDIDEAFGRTTFTVADSFVRLRTEAARFIGTNEQTSASVRGLTGLIDAVADNFQLLADATVIAATVIGGSLAGVAVARAISALSQLSLTAGTAQRALAFFGGPLGVVLTIAGGALAYVATQTDLLTTSQQALERATDSSYSALQKIASLTDDLAELAEEAERAGGATGDLAAVGQDAREALDALGDSASDAADRLGVQGRITAALTEIERGRTLQTLRQAIADNEAAQATIRRAAAARGLAAAMSRAQSLSDVRGTAARARAQQNSGLQGDEQAELDRLSEINSVLIEGLRTAQSLSPETWAALFERSTGGAARNMESAADSTAGATAASERAAEAGRNAYEMAALQDRIELARIENNVALADALSDHLEITRRTAEIKQQLNISEAEARDLATEYVEARREALNIEREHNIELRAAQNELEIARATGDERAQRAIGRRLELEARIAELRRLGVDESAAIDRAAQEVEALERADFRGRFRAWFGDGVRAAMEGDLDEFARERLREWAADGFERALNQIGDFLFDIGEEIITQALRGGQDGAAGALSTLFDGLLNSANETGAALKGALGAAAAEAAAQLALSSTAAATSAAKEVASAAQKSVAVASEITALGALTQAALAAAAALASVGASKGGSDIASIALKALSFGGGKASGGGVRPGNWYMVGENGPEPFVPTAPGVVIPNGALEGLKLLGQLPRFTPPPAAPSVNVNVVNQSGVNVDASVRPSADGVGFDVLLTRQTENALRSGRHDGALRDRWGVKPPRTRRS